MKKQFRFGIFFRTNDYLLFIVESIIFLRPLLFSIPYQAYIAKQIIIFKKRSQCRSEYINNKKDTVLIP